MNLIARSIMMAFALTVLVGAGGCILPTGPEIIDYLDPPAEDRWYDGAVVYAGSVSLEFRLKPENIAFVNNHRDTCWVRLDATDNGSFSSLTYYLHARPYTGEYRNANTKAYLGKVTLTPDNIADERVYEYLSSLDWLEILHAKRFYP